jgi:hypothetical protein
MTLIVFRVLKRHTPKIPWRKKRVVLQAQFVNGYTQVHFSNIATSIGLWLFRDVPMEVIPGRVLDLQIFFKPWNCRCGSTVIISGFGGLKFRGVIFDGFQRAPHIAKRPLEITFVWIWGWYYPTIFTINTPNAWYLRNYVLITNMPAILHSETRHWF